MHQPEHKFDSTAVTDFHGAGLGLRRGILNEPALQDSSSPVDFYEVAPENWICVGGRLGKQFESLVALKPLVCHGLSLSLGSPEPFDLDYLSDIKTFLKRYSVKCYSEHLSYCSDHGQLYDLMPIPFTEEAVRYVAKRIAFVQDFLERRIAIENVSFYAAPGQEMSELEFLNAVLGEVSCDVLLDVNNVYVNSVNHRYDPHNYINAVPAERICYYHVAGHYKEAEDLIVDTHGADVIEPVWSLLSYAYKTHGVRPTLLERDFNFPPMQVLFSELDRVKTLQQSTQVGEAYRVSTAAASAV